MSDKQRLAARALVVVGMLAAAGGVAADSAVSEEEFLMELPVVLSATRLEQPRAESPAAVTVIDRAMIEASGAREIYELFRLVPGFVVGAYTGYDPVVTNHGLSDQYSRRMQVLVDGRSVYMPAFGGVPWSSLPLAMEDIERIEVIRGPNASSYGSNSFLGVISITTRHAVEDFGWTAKLAAGEGGYGRGLLRYGGNRGDLDYRLTLGVGNDEGFVDRVDTQRLNLLSGRLDYRAANLDTWELQFGWSGGERESFTAGALQDPPRDYDLRSHFVMARWMRDTAPGESLSARLSHTLYEIDDPILSPPIPLGPFTVQAPMDLSQRSERYDFEFQQVATPRDGLRLVWGAGARLDRATMPLYLGRDDAVENRTLRLFGHAEWRPARDWLINVGGMLEDTRFTGTDFAPRLALNYTIAPRHTLRASLSRATRIPAALEDQADTTIRVPLPIPPWSLDDRIFTSTGALEAEEIISRELGYVGYFLDGRLAVDARIYHDELRDLITPTFQPAADLDGEVQVMENGHWADVDGFEAQLEYRPGPRTRLGLGYAYTDVDGSDRGTRYSDSAPEHTLSVLADQELAGRLRVGAAYHYVSEMLFLGEGDQTDAYSRLDLRLAQGFKRGGVEGELSLVMRNLLGDYVDFRVENRAEPQLLLELVLRAD